MVRRWKPVALLRLVAIVLMAAGTKIGPLATAVWVEIGPTAAGNLALAAGEPGQRAMTAGEFRPRPGMKAIGGLVERRVRSVQLCRRIEAPVSA